MKNNTYAPYIYTMLRPEFFDFHKYNIIYYGNFDDTHTPTHEKG